MKGLKGTIFVKTKKIQGKIVGEYLNCQFNAAGTAGYAGASHTMLILYSTEGQFHHVKASDFTPTSL